MGECEPGKLVGTIHVQVGEDVDQQQVLSQLINVLKMRFGFKNEKDITIQLEKTAFLDRCDPIHHSVYSEIVRIQRNKRTSANHKEIGNGHHGHSHHEHHHHGSGCNHDHHDHGHYDHGHDEKANGHSHAHHEHDHHEQEDHIDMTESTSFVKV